MASVRLEGPEGPVLWEETIPGGMQWSGTVRRGVTLRLTVLGAGANVSALLYNHEDRVERYNMADTLKAQHTEFLTLGHVCYSDMGRILCSITSDTAGWNDTVCGASRSRGEGKLTFEDGISAPGKYVEMRAEMDVICLISNCPQLNNPCNAYNPTPIRLLIWDAV